MLGSEKDCKKEGLNKEVKEISDKEKRKVEDVLHKVSRDIVDEAENNNSLIVIGELKGIGNRDTGNGKTMNRIVNSMPYWKLTNMIEYKAKEKRHPSSESKRKRHF
ncbi:MAG: IS605 OrfB-like transposable element containing RNAse H-like and Zn finger domain [Candidatus Methanohalarchaeum thermophilum]|uniref:IS605 OrfB-like transposable element containing RNAse H-like and Zn finger domain n=1 Tax=Methanohalarchaeum thermophilum TaxID=1903181 RepID=A0A1Q6DUD5_METT1|nr:MAG: IS605 OrfB-like transposable element containing RNAse H-like and Zn finger domain [Candidatus Methanohalarchaeum thermophilum]